MSVKISTDAEINSVRIKEQASAPDTPASGYGQIYSIGSGLRYLSSSGSCYLNNVFVPDLTDFTWVNQGSGTATQFENSLFLYAPAVAGDNYKLLVKDAPTAPYTITALIEAYIHPVDYNNVGLVFRQSSDGKFVTFTLANNSSTSNNSYVFQFDKLDSPTGSLSRYASWKIGHVHRLFLRIEDNGTNRVCSYSYDGFNFITLHTVGNTDFITADQVGFYACSVNANYPVAISILDWNES